MKGWHIVKRLACLVLTGLGAAFALPVSLSSSPSIAAERTTRAVIELFTSQGCSSCPPADALLAKLADDPTIVALSFPVDYWDYLGWKDTFARPEFSNRERDYASARGDRDVYTPQVVVDGRAHEVGSDAEGINEAIAATGGLLPISVGVEMAGDTVLAHIGGAVSANQTKATVWLVKYGRKETVNIGRGENSGHTVTYTNVVKEMQPVGLWKGQAMTVELPRDVISAAKNNGFALLLQTDMKGKPGPILGATILSDGNAS
jgi:hypothetical protein